MSYQYRLGYQDAIGYADDELLEFSGLVDVEADRHILFIGRDPAIADLYRCKLELDGYRTSFVSSQAEGHQAALSLTPDVIYLDLTTSSRWGTQILRAIRDDPAIATTPVVLLVRGLPGTKSIPVGRHDFPIPVRDIES